MAKKLKSLEEHNNSLLISGSGFWNSEPVKNGIACPKCGDELVDVNPNEVLTSIPPKKFIRCENKNCGYSGYRIA